MPSSDTHSLHFDVLPASHWLSLKPARETSRSHLQHTLLCLRRFCKRSSTGEQTKHFGSCQGSSALQPFQLLYHDKNKSLGSTATVLHAQLYLTSFNISSSTENPVSPPNSFFCHWVTANPLRSFDCLHSEQVLAKLLYAGLFTRINNSQGFNPVSSNITKSDFRCFVRRVSLLVGTALQVQLPRLASRHPVRAHSPQRAAAPAW